jgi:lipopolysaccharide transport system ATP-binding protein
MSSKEIAISIRELSKAYNIPINSVQHATSAEALLHWLSNPWRANQKETFWAVKEITFDVKVGEIFGLIGANGSGKSTLLKIISRITEPSSGSVDLYGRVGSLLEVGTGFHPELTGRENIFLNGTLLGMSRQQISSQFDAMVEFAGVEKFLDTPVKHYSSGMYVRLAFAVAAHLSSDILLVDEVLSVGDSEFQARCLQRIQEVSKSGRTVIYVSNDMQSVASLCGRAAWLRKGRLEFVGNVRDALSQYDKAYPRAS